MVGIIHGLTFVASSTSERSSAPLHARCPPPHQTCGLTGCAALSLVCIDKSENIIEHPVAACTVGEQLKDLRVIHRPFLLVDLQSAPNDSVICPHLSTNELSAHTSSAPVTMTNIPYTLCGCPSGSAEGCGSSVEGCASSVATR